MKLLKCESQSVVSRSRPVNLQHSSARLGVAPKARMLRLQNAKLAEAETDLILKKGKLKMAPDPKIVTIARHLILFSSPYLGIAEKKEKKHKDDDEDDFDDDLGLSPQQVEAFLTVLCDETDIAEVSLKMGGFKMKVRRSLHSLPATASSAPAAAAAPAPAAAAAAAPSYAPAASDYESEEESDDESLVPVTATKVGIFRRGRYVKGKQVGKAPVVDIGATVKKGQAVAFIEQMGTYWPLEAPQAGEIAGFVLEEGEPVEYGQPVLELAPFFGGHIIGDSKYA
jgi:biotin carboxyl carrier protein